MTAPRRRVAEPASAGAERGLAQVFGWPLALALASGAGLLAALLGDGGWDALGWVLLAPPVALGLRGLLRASRRR